MLREGFEDGNSRLTDNGKQSLNKEKTKTGFKRWRGDKKLFE